MTTKFLLDSGDPEEYKTVASLANAAGQVLWGSTTNPSLIAKKLAGQKVSASDAFSKLQKELVEEILAIVPGAVSAEVFSNLDTKAEEMIAQGEEIASWHPRVVVKLPTTIEGFKARSVLRSKGITINNTLVFSQEQVYAVSLQEKLLQQTSGPTKSGWPCFISPFLGRLDDKGENGLTFLKDAIAITHKLFEKDLVWMLAASIRNTTHLKESIAYESELVTVPAKVYAEWFALSPEQQAAVPNSSQAPLKDVPVWHPSDAVSQINTVDDLQSAMEQGGLNISHPLTTAGIEKFVSDWHQIIV